MLRNRLIVNVLSICLISLGMITGCDFDKEIGVPLPQAPAELFVECYLQDGQVPRLLLTDTQSYFDSIGLPQQTSARVVLTGSGGYADTLRFGPSLDRFTQKYANYTGTKPTWLNAGNQYSLQIIAADGRSARATTSVQAPVPIDSIQYGKSTKGDSTAYIVAWCKDDATQQDYYRIIANKDTLNTEASTSYIFQDNQRNGLALFARTGYNFKIGQTVIVRLFHLEPAYYNWLQSVRNAQNSNGNPFATPAVLRSNIEGGLGIFTALTYDQDSVMIK